ncbi:AAA family ATPase [Vibrio sp. 3-2(1)]|uniref:AAA family ATPase n=1 Tax=Vibrio sp. 3-2(1) TaxID=2591016 RepID=UPI00148372A5|nr:AAA family ATPase [Vibrio sp. 3-2(1)]NNN70521.1 AAA family ATPase [Vibrio sp. 3-2(1)]
MLVKGFKGKNIFGYLNFDISFHKDVSFLIGMNGSGKTTALKLMSALITASFKDLLKISFDNISITLEDRGKAVKIYCKTKGTNKLLGVTGVSTQIIFDAPSEEELSFYNHHDEKIDEMVQDLIRQNVNSPVIERISKIKAPIFLGLDRRANDIKNGLNDYFFERQLWLTKKKSTNAAKRLITGSLGTSLMETELLVQNTYRRIRELEQAQSHKLRDSILMSAFQYHGLDLDTTSNDEINNWREKQGLVQRRNEIKDALANIGLKNSSVSDEVDSFFEKVNLLFEELQTFNKGLTVEWLLNKAQVDRMAKIVEIIDEHNTKLEKLFDPINNFINTINVFYKDSNKQLKVNAVGQLLVMRPDAKQCTIEGLSSGERQLLIIFAHAFFNSSGGKSVFIVDEPELSLHLGWQEKFTETIFSIDKNTQFILATHSPEIVSNHVDKAIFCRQNEEV